MVVKKDLDSMIDGQVIEGMIYVKSYAVRPTKSGNKYIDGVAEMKGTVTFKVWSGVAFDEMDRHDYQGLVCYVTAKVNEYNGNKGLVLTTIRALEEGAYDVSEFFEERYNTEAYWKAMRDLVAGSCSAEALEIYDEVFRGIENRFKVEFAARTHHDAVRSGLLAHTYKVAYIMSCVIRNYSFIVSRCSVDALILGCCFHDIGKIYEYSNGVIVGSGLVVSHNTFGVEYLAGFKSFIVDRKGEEFYYRLVSVIVQHHGEFGERPRSVEAFLVHMADYLESSFQGVNESLEKGLSCISLNDFKLN